MVRFRPWPPNFQFHAATADLASSVTQLIGDRIRRLFIPWWLRFPQVTDLTFNIRVDISCKVSVNIADN